MIKRITWLLLAILLVSGLACRGRTTPSPNTKASPTPTPTTSPVYSREEALEFARVVSAIREERKVLQKETEAFSQTSTVMTGEDAVAGLNEIIRKESDLQTRMSQIKRPSIPSARAVQDAYLIVFTRELLALNELRNAIATGDQSKFLSVQGLTEDAMVYSIRAEQEWNRMLAAFSISEDELK